jgi:hypothetical protein
VGAAQVLAFKLEYHYRDPNRYPDFTLGALFTIGNIAIFFKASYI